MAFSQGATDKKAISAVSLLDKREILKNAIDVQNEEGLIDVMILGGKMKETKQPIYHDYIEDALHTLMDTTGATITGSGTATVSGVTLTAATSGYARKGLKVLFPNGKVGQIQSNTPSGGQDVLVIKSVDGTNLTLTAGMKLAPLSVLVGERSTAPANLKTGWTKYFNLTEKFREVNEITDVQLTSEIELEFNGSNYVFNRDIANKFILFKGGINATMIAGQISATKFEDASPAFTDPGNGGAQQTTRGLNQYVTTYGVNDTVDVAGTIDLDDMESYFNLLTAARAPKSYTVYSSNAVAMKFANFLKGLNSSGVTSGRMSLDGKEIDFGVSKWSYGNYNLQFAGLGIFDHPIILSQTDIVKSAYFVPDGKTSTKGGGLEDRMCIRYVKTINPGYGNNIWEEWDNGALARGGAIGDERVRRTNWYTEQGLQILGAQHFGKLVVL